MSTRVIQISVALFALNACGQKASDSGPSPAASAPVEKPQDTAHEANNGPQAEVKPLEVPAVPAGAKVFFAEPADGAKVQGPLENGNVAVHVKMAADGIAIKPAGAVEAGSGHHHIIVDADVGVAGSVVPKDAQHLHFGQGQTEATLELAPGEHTLRLQLADGIHRSYGPQLSSSIKISVAAGTPRAGSESEPTTKPRKTAP